MRVAQLRPSSAAWAALMLSVSCCASTDSRLPRLIAESIVARRCANSLRCATMSGASTMPAVVGPTSGSWHRPAPSAPATSRRCPPPRCVPPPAGRSARCVPRGHAHRPPPPPPRGHRRRPRPASSPPRRPDRPPAPSRCRWRGGTAAPPRAAETAATGDGGERKTGTGRTRQTPHRQAMSGGLTPLPHRERASTPPCRPTFPPARQA